MSLWATIKNWLNIGGVKVLLWKYTEPLSRSNPVIKGAALLKSKANKTVLGMEIRVIEEFTKTETEGEGEEKKSQQKTETTVLASVKFPEFDAGVGYPLDLKGGENKEQTFELFVDITPRLQNYGGVVGSLGKLAAWVTKEKVEYFLVAEARVKGSAFAASDKKKLKIGD